MSMPRQHSLQRRLFAFTSAIGIGVTIVMSLIMMTAELRHDRAELKHLLSDTVRALGSAAARESLDELVDHPLVRFVCVYDSAGQLAAERVELGARCPVVVQEDTEGILTTSLYQAGELLGELPGVLQTHWHAGNAMGYWLQLAWPVVLAILVLLGVVLLASRSLARHLTRPIRQLTKSASEFDPQAPGFHLEESGLDEVDSLGGAFARVVASLTNANQSTAGALAQQRAAQTAERETRELLTQIVDLAPILIFAVNKHGQVLFANKAVAELYDTRLEELMEPEFRAKHASETDRLICAPFTTSKDPEEVWHTQPKSGETRRFLVFRVPYLSDEATLVIGTDITKEHRLQLQLQFSQRLEVIGTLAGGIAHDFNNLLTPILGYTSMLIDSDLPDDVRQKLRAVQTAGERARDVVHQILTFSRQQRTEPSRELLDPVDVVADATQLMRASIPPDITLTEQRTFVGKVRADPSQLHQVIVNLCTNAAQAIQGSHGHITIEVSKLGPSSPLIPPHLPAGEYACIAVTDNGRGMSEDVMNHVFEPFFTTKEVGEGSGLGLSVVHGIVVAHQGDITVESVEGQGATFRVLLPLAADAVSVDPDAVPHSVLLVDDDQSVLRMTSELLRHYGYRVSAMHDPREALDALRSDPDAFDVLITDHNMPELTGAELATAVRSLRADIPIILITGFASVAAKDLEGIDHKLMKPVSGRELTLVIQTSLSGRRSAA